MYLYEHGHRWGTILYLKTSVGESLALAISQASKPVFLLKVQAIPQTYHEGSCLNKKPGILEQKSPPSEIYKGGLKRANNDRTDLIGESRTGGKAILAWMNTMNVGCRNRFHLFVLGDHATGAIGGLRSAVAITRNTRCPRAMLPPKLSYVT